MKTRNTVAAAALVLATTFAGVSSANVSTGSIDLDVQSAANSAGVGVSVSDDGVASLFGNVDSRADEQAAKMAALEFPGVTSVISNINASN